MRAVILAGGFGTRLRPLTINFPKPMAPVANQPMMEHVVRLCERHGFRDIVAMLHYSPDVITRYFESGKNWDVKISYLRPEVDLETAGCVRFAADQEGFEDLRSDPFLIISGDVLTDINLGDALKFHREKKAVATIVLTRVVKPLAYGVVITKEDGRISRFLEKPTWGEVFSDTINTGIYILNPEVFDYIPKDQPFDFSKHLFPKLLEQGLPIYGYVAPGYWKDVGDLTEYRTAHMDILEGGVDVLIKGETLDKQPKVKVGPGTQIESGVRFDGTVVIGKNCQIARGVEITQSVIGDNVTIGTGASIRKSVVWDRTAIGPDTDLREAVIARDVRIGQGARVEVGAIVANRCVIGPGAVLKPSVKMWPEKTVENGAVLSSSLVWGERWNRGLFGNEGITGLTNIEITAEFAAKLGAAYGAYLGPGAYVITSRDAHKSSRMIKRAIISGLLSGGVKVGDIRMNPVPVVRYEMGKEGESGGVHVRVTPDDSRQVDIRIFDKDGNDIPIRKEKAIEQLFMREDFKRAKPQEIGELTVPPRAQEYYRGGFLKTINNATIRRRKFRVVIDYSHSPAALILPEILGEMEVETVGLNANTSSMHVSRTEGERRQAMQELSHIVTTLKADAGFLMDNGAEKLWMVDEMGRVIPSEDALVIVGLMASQANKEGVLCYPVRGSSALEKQGTLRGATVIRTPMHPRHLLDYARRPNVNFVAEPDGGFIFPEFQPAFDAMYAVAKILEMVSSQNTTLGRCWDQVQGETQVLHRRVPCAWGSKGRVMRYAQTTGEGQKVELIDGVKIHFVDGWVLVLPDADQAYCHIWSEASTEKKTRNLLDEYSKKVEEWQKMDDSPSEKLSTPTEGGQSSSPISSKN